MHYCFGEETLPDPQPARCSLGNKPDCYLGNSPDRWPHRVLTRHAAVIRYEFAGNGELAYSSV
jgi:hypothetical protein